jgi:hypothetical protein
MVKLLEKQFGIIKDACAALSLAWWVNSLHLGLLCDVLLLLLGNNGKLIVKVITVEQLLN